MSCCYTMIFLNTIPVNSALYVLWFEQFYYFFLEIMKLRLYSFCLLIYTMVLQKTVSRKESAIKKARSGRREDTLIADMTEVVIDYTLVQQNTPSVCKKSIYWKKITSSQIGFHFWFEEKSCVSFLLFPYIWWVIRMHFLSSTKHISFFPQFLTNAPFVKNIQSITESRVFIRF